MNVSNAPIDRSKKIDAKLVIFGILSKLPFKKIRSYGRRAYYGRRRAFVSVDLDQVISDLPPNPVIIDLGANNGSFSRRVADIAAELHVFEPDPQTFASLSESLSGYQNVTLYNAAIGAFDGEIEFYRGMGFESNPHSASLSSSIFAEHEGVEKTESLTVPQVGILSLLERIGKKVDLIKMDIEGSEVPVLETLLASPLSKEVSVILVETHEHVLPNLVERTFALRQRAAKISRPAINMDWH